MAPIPSSLTRWETEALGGLATTISQLAAAASSAEVQRLAHSAARRLTGADGASLVLCDDGLCRYVDEDAIAPLFKGRSFPIDHCVSGWAIRTGEIVVIEDIYADDRVPHELYRPTFVTSLLIAPIRARDPLGAICLYWARPHRATDGQVAIAGALAASAAVALDRARLSAELERRRMTEEDLRTLSERDPLTGVLNRRAWDQALSSAIRKGLDPLHVALVDLDDFKGYNDRNGHIAGDRLLRLAAAAWRRAVRAGDVLARYGGEEFAVLLAGCDTPRAMEIAERLRRATVGGQHVSIGVARWDGRESAEQLVDRADRALYDAKRAGRNRVHLAP